MAAASKSSVAMELLLETVPGVGSQLATLWQAAQRSDARRVTETVLAARGYLDNDVAFLEKLRSSEVLLDLLREAVEAARRTAWEEKRHTLGRLVGKAMVDDAELDVSAALLTALAGLDSQDIRELLRVRDEVRQAKPSIMPSAPTVPEPWRAHLVAHGCLTIDYGAITPIGGRGQGGQWISGVSDFGELLLEWLRSADHEGGESPGRTGS